jgi:hypothetical protein
MNTPFKKQALNSELLKVLGIPTALGAHIGGAAGLVRPSLSQEQLPDGEAIGSHHPLTRTGQGIVEGGLTGLGAGAGTVAGAGVAELISSLLQGREFGRRNMMLNKPGTTESLLTLLSTLGGAVAGGYGGSRAGKAITGRKSEREVKEEQSGKKKKSEKSEEKSEDKEDDNKSESAGSEDNEKEASFNHFTKLAFVKFALVGHMPGEAGFVMGQPDLSAHMPYGGGDVTSDIGAAQRAAGVAGSGPYSEGTPRNLSWLWDNIKKMPLGKKVGYGAAGLTGAGLTAYGLDKAFSPTPMQKFTSGIDPRVMQLLQNPATQSIIAGLIGNVGGRAMGVDPTLSTVLGASAPLLYHLYRNYNR